jgi:hypothetical protein
MDKQKKREKTADESVQNSLGRGHSGSGLSKK